jgi:hypothetical protein
MQISWFTFLQIKLQNWCMTWHSSRDFIGASLALATYLLAAPALAHTSDAWEQCAGQHAATVDKQIEGCTLAIQSSGGHRKDWCKP